jgi:hypothetical protein
MLSNLNIKKFYAIDLWRPYKEYIDKENSVTTQDLGINDGDEVFKETQSKLLKYTSVEILRSSSREAASVIPDKSLDFCFIDANHEYDYVTEDIKTWLPKIKHQGILSGHDFQHKPVRKAVHACLGKKGFKVDTEGSHFSGYPTCWHTIV